MVLMQPMCRRSTIWMTAYTLKTPCWRDNRIEKRPCMQGLFLNLFVGLLVFFVSVVQVRAFLGGFFRILLFPVFINVLFVVSHFLPPFVDGSQCGWPTRGMKNSSRNGTRTG